MVQNALFYIVSTYFAISRNVTLTLNKTNTKFLLLIKQHELDKFLCVILA